jgi:hypothetical protein
MGATMAWVLGILAGLAVNLAIGVRPVIALGVATFMLTIAAVCYAAKNN